MAIATYGDLVQAIKDWTGRGGEATFVANIPAFIQRPHTVLMRELRIPLLQAAVDLSITGESVALPSDFRAVSRLFIDADWDNPLSPTSQEGRVRIAVGNDAGRPLVYAIEGTNIAFGPIPDATYTGKLLYYKTLPTMSADGDTNALLVRHPFVYLYGALAEAARYDQNDENISLYEGMFGAELNAIQTAEALDAMAGGTLSQVVTGTIV
jgi:hypothetical protein